MARQNNASYEGQGQRKVKQVTALDIYPIGAIYLSINPENPSNIFGGTWKLLAPGRTLVCIDTGQQEFNQAGKTGGTKTNQYTHTHSTKDHALTVAELPSHSHDFTDQVLSVNRNAITGAYDTPSSNYGFQNTTGSWFAGWYKGTDTSTQNTGNSKAHNHGDVSDVKQSISTLQPYFTCYMWIRTS
jgi:hypothetical protein